VQTLEDFLKTYNENPKPFVWTKKVDQILEKVICCKAIMERLHYAVSMSTRAGAPSPPLIFIGRQ
jgi:hypothetical protein